ncbi:MAG: nitroreductase family protein [Clostridia bacterium]|nr:nitroreductase family protein [Clostridia bacterium]
MNEIFKRVSIRKFQDKAVEKEKIEEILKAAMAAPSAANRQPWEFYVVTDDKKKQQLAETSAYSKPAAKAPVVIVTCYNTTVMRFPEFNLVDLGAATENILLEATSLGLGSCWLAVAPDDKRMKLVEEALEINPEEMHAFAMVAIGYSDEEKEQEDRFDKNKIHYV